MQESRYEGGEKKLGYAELCKLLTGWRSDSETLWLGSNSPGTDNSAFNGSGPVSRAGGTP